LVATKLQTYSDLGNNNMIYSKFYSKEMKLMMAIVDKDPNTITDIEFDNPITFLNNPIQLRWIAPSFPAGHKQHAA
jgi:hypothetical protein